MKHILITTIAAVLLVGTAFADPIHDVVNIGDIGDVQAELDAGADVKDEDDGTPLDWAIKYMTAKTEYKHTKTADLLRKHGGKTGEELETDP